MDDWLNEQKWEKNDRIIETFISGGGKDLHGDIVDIEKMKDVMPWLVENGFYEWQHEGFPIGKFLGWKHEDGKIKVKVGIYDSTDSKFPQHDQIWNVIKNWHQKYGNHGQSSIKGLPVKERIIRYGGRIANKLDLIPMWAVGWVGNNAANKDAVVTRINTAAKAFSIERRIALITKSLMTVAKQATTIIEKRNGEIMADKTKEEKFNSELLEKARHYVDNSSDAPKGAKLQRGERGGIYYEDGGKAPATRQHAPGEQSTKQPVSDKEKKVVVTELFRAGEGKYSDKQIYDTLVGKHGFEPEEAMHYVKQRNLMADGEGGLDPNELETYTEPDAGSKMAVTKQATTIIEKRNGEIMAEKKKEQGDGAEIEAPATETPPEAPAEEAGVMAEIEKLETAVTRMAQALTSIDQGTPEVAGEIAAAAEDAVAIVAAGGEEAKEKATASEMTEIKKRLNGLQKSVGDLAGQMEIITKKLSRPVQKSKGVVIQPKQKGIMPQTADESVELFNKIRNGA